MLAFIRQFTFVVLGIAGAVVGLCVLVVVGVSAFGAIANVKSQADKAWVRSTIHQGTSRNEVYAALRGRRLDAYWLLSPQYTLSTPGGTKCAEALAAHRSFPPMDRSLPSACANPVVLIEYQKSGNIACGSWTYQTFSFSDDDRLAWIDESDNDLIACL